MLGVIPGQERRTRRAQRLANGVPMPRELIAQLDQLAGELKVKPLLARCSAFEVAVYAMWAGTLFSLPWVGSLAPALGHLSARAIGATLFLGLAPSAVGFALWAYATARMDVGRVTTSLYLVPAVAIAVSFVWLGDVPSGVQLSTAKLVFRSIQQIHLVTVDQC